MKTAKELKLTKSNLIRKAIMEFISRYEFKKELEESKNNYRKEE